MKSKTIFICFILFMVSIIGAWYAIDTSGKGDFSGDSTMEAGVISCHPTSHINITINSTITTTGGEVTDTAMYLGGDATTGDIIQFVPDTGWANIYIQEYTVPNNLEYKVNTSGSPNWINATFGGFNSSEQYGVTVDGIGWDTLTTGSDGTLYVNYSSWSNHTFRITGEPLGGDPPVVTAYTFTNGTQHFDIRNDSLSINISDPEGDLMDCTFELEPSSQATQYDNNSANDTTGIAIIDPSPLDYSTTYTFYANVSDGTTTTHAYFVFTTNNEEPEVVSPNIANGSTGVSISKNWWNATVQDPNGDKIDYTMYLEPTIAGEDVSQEGRSNETAQHVLGYYDDMPYGTAYIMYVNITDGNSTNYTWFTFTTEDMPNTPPTASNPSIPDGRWSVNAIETHYWNCTISDAEGHGFNWTIETAPDIGDSSGNDQANGTKSCSIIGLANSTLYTVYVNTTDTYNVSNQTFTFHTHTTGNTNPTATPTIGNGTSDVDISTYIWWNATFADVNGDLMNVTMAYEPSPLNLNATYANQSNGSQPVLLNYHEELSYNTVYTVYVNISDGKDGTYYWFTFTTEENPNPPVAVTSNIGNGTTGVPLATVYWNTTISDGNGDVMNLTIESTPDSSSVSYYNQSNATKSLVAGTFTQYNTLYTVFVNISDGRTMKYYWFTFTTETAGGNSAPIISSPSIANGTANVSLATATWSCTIQDPDGDSFNWTIQTLPNVGSNSANGASNGSKSASLSGLAYSTEYTVYINATDGSLSKYWFYTFTTESEGNDPPTVEINSPANGSTASWYSGTVGQVRIQVYANDTEGDTLTVHFWNMTPTAPAPPILLNVTTGVTANTTVSFVWTGLENGTQYNWSVDIYDGTVWVNDTATWNFITPAGGGGEANYTYVAETNGSVTFTDTTGGSPNNWTWDFGDYGSSYDENPTHQYNLGNVYTVNLTATDGVDTWYVEKEVIVNRTVNLTSGIAFFAWSINQTTYSTQMGTYFSGSTSLILYIGSDLYSTYVVGLGGTNFTISPWTCFRVVSSSWNNFTLHSTTAVPMVRDVSLDANEFNYVAYSVGNVTSPSHLSGLSSGDTVINFTIGQTFETYMVGIGGTNWDIRAYRVMIINTASGVGGTLHIGKET